LLLLCDWLKRPTHSEDIIHHLFGSVEFPDRLEVWNILLPCQNQLQLQMAAEHQFLN
jgi:hypothetical protein